MIRPHIDPELLQEAMSILSAKFAIQTLVKNVVFLSEPSRRNLVLRITLENADDLVPQSVILKQATAGEDNDDTAGRLARDWAGLEFLSSLKIGSLPVPKFYGGSQKHHFILFEDLGEVHFSLVDSLTGQDRSGAESALKRYVKVVGQLHSLCYGHTDEYKAILHNLHPGAKSWQDDLAAMLAKISPVLQKFNIPFHENLKNEINTIFKIVEEPGPFTTLMHGDICPDNVFDNPVNNQMHIIDFEWSFICNALLDGVALRMAMPTCWCVKAFPEELIAPLELIYRQQLMKTIPAAGNDELYYESYVAACAYWMLWVVVYLEDILVKEIDPSDPKYHNYHRNWKGEDNLRRPRNLYRLQAFIKVASQHDIFPNLRSMAEQILKELYVCWPEVNPLELYPAFR